MKRFLLLLFALSAFFLSNAQKQIIVQDGNNATIFTSLDSAVAMAPAGSYIYLPGGNFDLQNDLVIDKEIHIIGVGHYPDSTAATGRTLIEGGSG